MQLGNLRHPRDVWGLWEILECPARSAGDFSQGYTFQDSLGFGVEICSISLRRRRAPAGSATGELPCCGAEQVARRATQQAQADNPRRPTEDWVPIDAPMDAGNVATRDNCPQWGRGGMDRCDIFASTASLAGTHIPLGALSVPRHSHGIGVQNWGNNGGTGAPSAPGGFRIVA